MRRRIVVMGLALVATPALAYKLVPHGQRVAVAKSILMVEPPIDWNRMQSRPGRYAESWTLDGIALNEVTFYGGVESGRTLFREVDRKNRPLPHFSTSMLATDVVQYFEASYRIAGGSALFAIDRIEPATFAGLKGFRFEYSFTLEGEEVKRRGEGTGAIAGSRLYLITYEAPALHYYARNLGDYRAVVASARLAVPAVQVR